METPPADRSRGSGGGGGASSGASPQSAHTLPKRGRKHMKRSSSVSASRHTGCSWRGTGSALPQRSRRRGGGCRAASHAAAPGICVTPAAACARPHSPRRRPTARARSTGPSKWAYARWTKRCGPRRGSASLRRFNRMQQSTAHGRPACGAAAGQLTQRLPQPTCHLPAGDVQADA